VKPVVANASPLIALAKIDRFSLLKQLFGDIWIPDAVWHEVVIQGAGKPAAESTITAEQESWLQRHSIVDTLAVEVLQATLGAGEAEAIVLAQEVSAKWVLLDDDLARVQAERLGLRVKGSIGLLLASYQAHYIDDLQADIDTLRARGFWLADRLYRTVLEKAGYTLT
jgi:predicted nucleic acid-binding protein